MPAMDSRRATPAGPVAAAPGPPGRAGAPGPLTGRLLDSRYLVGDLVATGGMAAVYRAQDTRLDRGVAVKVLHGALAEDPDFVHRFHDEAKAAAGISHPHVVAVTDQGVEGGVTERDGSRRGGIVFLVMEFVAGRTLRQVLADRGRLTPRQALEVLGPVAAALAAAHARGIVHRDVKPENILLGDDGRVVVTDFGLARAVTATPRTAAAGLLLGTVAYVAPEQVTTGAADARTDVYAAGCVLYEMLTGRPPYEAATPLAVAYRHVNDRVPAPSATPGVPADLDDLVARCTEPDPGGRPADGFALGRLVRAAGGPAAAPSRESEDATVVLPAGDPDATRALPRPDTATRALPLDPAARAAALAHSPHPGTSVVRPDGSHPTAALPLGGKAPRRRRRWIIGLVVLVLALGAAGGGWWGLVGRFTRAPSLAGLAPAQAQTALTRDHLGFAEDAPTYSETVQAGLVAAQTPGAGAHLTRGRVVHVRLSQGPERYAVPHVVGLSQDAARAKLDAAHLVVGTVTQQYSDSVSGGTVLAQNPPPDLPVKPGTSVTLTVSQGPAPVTVQDQTGRPYDAAAALLTGLGLKVTRGDAFSDTVPSGTVISQSPASGTLTRNSTVTLTVSKGPQVTTVPDVTGLALTDARTKLVNAGFPEPTVRSLPGGPKKVLGQSPSGNTQVPTANLPTVILYVF
ncbi:MAG: serine/threonine protein kinase [Mycobacterium sp.]|nr:serine/threonine protein kinase [Mycobacterium sp.]